MGRFDDHGGRRGSPDRSEWTLDLQRDQSITCKQGRNLEIGFVDSTAAYRSAYCTSPADAVVARREVEELLVVDVDLNMSLLPRLRR